MTALSASARAAVPFREQLVRMLPRRCDHSRFRLRPLRFRCSLHQRRRRDQHVYLPFRVPRALPAEIPTGPAVVRMHVSRIEPVRPRRTFLDLVQSVRIAGRGTCR